ncbi:hypothetical protein MMC27_001768 [Xylographa pallens]|nr:hypothetical protein [Xylographa pallens]
MAYSLPNISVAIFLNRILSPNRWRRWMIYAIVIAQSVIAAISCVILFTQCTPTASLWDPAVSGTCLPSSVITGYSYFVGAYSAFTDIFLAVIPIAAFWKLQMKLKTKIGLGLLMGMTSIAAIAAIVKTTKLYELADVMDFTYDTVDLVIWAIVEANVIIIAACIPTLRPFVINVQHSVKGSNAHSFFNRRGYKLEDSNKALALHPSYEHSGEFENGITQHATVQGPVNPIFDPSDETGIRQTTKITAEWNQV